MAQDKSILEIKNGNKNGKFYRSCYFQNMLLIKTVWIFIVFISCFLCSDLVLAVSEKCLGDQDNSEVHLVTRLQKFEGNLLKAINATGSFLCRINSPTLHL